MPTGDSPKVAKHGNQLSNSDDALAADASFMVAALVDSGEEGSWALGLLDGVTVYAPHLLLVEATNVLRRQEASGGLVELAVHRARRRLVEMPIQLFPFEPFADRIWQLRHNLTSYDAWYVAIAEALEIPLATLDQRLVSASGPTCRFLVPPDEE